MILIGRHLSPFVRRSAAVLNLTGAAFDRKELAAATDGEAAYERSQRPNELAHEPLDPFARTQWTQE